MSTSVVAIRYSRNETEWLALITFRKKISGPVIRDRENIGQ